MQKVEAAALLGHPDVADPLLERARAGATLLPGKLQHAAHVKRRAAESLQAAGQSRQ